MLRKWLNQTFGIDDPADRSEDDPRGQLPDPESLDKNMIVHELQADVHRIQYYATEEEGYAEAHEHVKNSILTGFLRLGERFSRIKEDAKPKYNERTGKIEEHARLDASDMPEDMGGFRKKRNLIAHNYEAAYEEDVDAWIEEVLPFAQEEIDDYWLEDVSDDEDYSYIDDDLEDDDQ